MNTTPSPQVQFQREPLADREEEVQFTQTQTYEEFENEVSRWVARRVLSRTGGAHREQSLVPSGSLLGLYNTVQPGQTIRVHAHFHSNGFSYRRLTFSQQGEEIFVFPITRPRPQPERGQPPLPEIPEVSEAVEDIRAAGRSSSTSPIHPLVGATASGARVATVFTGSAALEAIAAPIAAAISSFQMLWTVFFIFEEIEGEKAAGMGAVDFVWTLASRALNNSNASPHEHAILYAQSMEEHNGTGDTYRDALRAAREHADRAWGNWNEQDRARIRAAFSNVNELGDYLFSQVEPIMQRNIRVYAQMWHHRWRGGRTFYQG